MKLNCIIVDDEALARKGLAKYVADIDFLELRGICKNALEANNILNQEKIDLFFLDIEMPILNGIDFLKTLHKAPKVIFTTAYSEYAIDSFEFDVLDYLLKPISFERFLQSANKAYRLIANTKVSTVIEVSNTAEDDFIFIKTDKQLVKVMHKDILFVESMQNYVRVFTENDCYITLVPLKKVLEVLPKNQFIQVHKSYVIAKNKVEAIVGNQIIIKENQIPISRNLKEEVVDILVADKVLRK